MRVSRESEVSSERGTITICLERDPDLAWLTAGRLTRNCDLENCVRIYLQLFVIQEAMMLCQVGKVYKRQTLEHR